MDTIEIKLSSAPGVPLNTHLERLAVGYEADGPWRREVFAPVKWGAGVPVTVTIETVGTRLVVEGVFAESLRFSR